MIKTVMTNQTEFYRLRDLNKLQPNKIYFCKTFIVRISFCGSFTWEIDFWGTPGSKTHDASFYFAGNKTASFSAFMEKIDNELRQDIEWFLWNFDSRNLRYIGDLSD